MTSPPAVVTLPGSITRVALMVMLFKACQDKRISCKSAFHECLCMANHLPLSPQSVPLVATTYSSVVTSFKAYRPSWLPKLPPVMMLEILATSPCTFATPAKPSDINESVGSISKSVQENASAIGSAKHK